jgi:hypothetical protein
MAAGGAKADWVTRVLGYRFPAAAAALPGGAADAMAGWQAARGTALASLRALEGAFRAMKQPQTDRAIILLRAIQANLTAAPATPAQVGELERYLGTDRIIEEAEMPNGFGFKVELRVPLLAALAALKREQAASPKAPA